MNEKYIRFGVIDYIGGNNSKSLLKPKKFLEMIYKEIEVVERM